MGRSLPFQSNAGVTQQVEFQPVFFLTKLLTKSSKNQKGLQTEICNPLFYMVRLAGIEPTTPWFVAKYSIQLSYSREKRNYSITLTIYGSAA
jgi:hypothetical protein